MTIYFFGNRSHFNDSAALDLIPVIKAEFPKLNLIHVDPTEEFIPSQNSIIIDSVKGIDKITVFKSLDDFKLFPQISVHDYDLILHLRLLGKLGKLSKVTVIGIPVGVKVIDLKYEVINLIRKFLEY